MLQKNKMNSKKNYKIKLNKFKQNLIKKDNPFAPD